MIVVPAASSVPSGLNATVRGESAGLVGRVVTALRAMTSQS